MKSSALTWACRVLWLLLPFTLGDAFARTLDGASSNARVVWQLALWSGWALVLLASLVQIPVTLSVIRIGMPVAPVLAAIFMVRGGPDSPPNALSVAGLLIGAVVAVLVMGGEVGNDFIDGASYGDERRLGLRPPGFLIVGPIQALWLLAAAPLVGAVALAAAAQWAPAAVLGVIAAGCTWYSFRLLDRLSKRCLVLVPAGLTLVDPLALAEPTLFRRDDIVRLGPAPADSDGLDLTVGAPGLIVSVEFNRALSVVPAAGRREAAEPREVGGVLLALSRPGRLLELAESRHIAVERR